VLEHQDYLEVAEQASKKSNCVSRQVGCVIVRDFSVISTGWNGVAFLPETNCVDAGCPRCKMPNRVTGIGYDRCICIHAEQFAIAKAAKDGVSLDGATLYATLRPCITCLANTLAAGIVRVVYSADWVYEDAELECAHKRLRAQFVEFIRDDVVVPRS
jgi:dCMP deaminase